MLDLADIFVNSRAATLILALFALLPFALVPLFPLVNWRRRQKSLPAIVVPPKAIAELIVGWIAVMGILYLIVSVVLAD